MHLVVCACTHTPHIHCTAHTLHTPGSALGRRRLYPLIQSQHYTAVPNSQQKTPARRRTFCFCICHALGYKEHFTSRSRRAVVSVHGALSRAETEGQQQHARVFCRIRTADSIWDSENAENFPLSFFLIMPPPLTRRFVQEVCVSGGLAPFDEVSIAFRGPMKLHNIAWYEGTTDETLERTSGWTRG